MTEVELEHAAMAPHRWIRCCTAFANRHSVHSGATLCPTSTRIIQDPLADSGTQFFLVPGGRYLLSYSLRGMCVWDLGYTPNTNCKLLASIGPEGGCSFCMVNATSDGMGLIIVAVLRHRHCSVYEIYPQSETPHFAQLAHLPFSLSRRSTPYLWRNRVIWYSPYEDGVLFTVWDYRLNHSICFFVDVDVDNFFSLKLLTTKTAIIVLCESEEVFVFAIPPLSPHEPSDIFDHDPALMPSLFRFTLPDGLARRTEFIHWETMPSWYSGTSQSLYLDALLEDLKLYGFNLVIKPNLSDISLHVTNACQLMPYDYNFINFQTYGICEGNLVSCWDIVDPNQCTVHIRSKSSRPAKAGGPIVLNVLLSGTESGESLSTCPASGRFVHLDRNDNHRIVVVDFIPFR